jgi:hypothetical protein
MSATYSLGEVVYLRLVPSDETLFPLEVNFPPVKGLDPGFAWLPKLRLLTHAPIWGNTINNNQLIGMDWNRAQQDAYEGNAEAAYLMAHKLIKEQTLYGRAAFLFDSAAAKGHAPAQNDIGVLYLFGLGVPRDAAKAVYYFTKAASKGEAMAEVNLGLCHLLGLGGVPKNAGRAESLIASAARKKQPVAAIILAAGKAANTELSRKNVEEAYKLVLTARAYGADWPLEDKTSGGASYFLNPSRLETYIAVQIPEGRLRILQSQLSLMMPPSPPPSQTLKDWMEFGRKPDRGSHEKVHIIGPAVSAPATNTVVGGK